MKKERHRIAHSFVLPLKMPESPTRFPLLQQTAIAEVFRNLNSGRELDNGMRRPTPPPPPRPASLNLST